MYGSKHKTMKNLQNNPQIVDISSVDISTMSIDEFKMLKSQVNANFDRELEEIKNKLPSGFPAILAHSHGFNAVHVREVKNGRRRNTKILQALKELVKNTKTQTKKNE